MIHRHRVHMWSGGTVDTVDRHGGREQFRSFCQVRVGSTSTTGGLTRAPTHIQSNTHTKLMVSATWLSNCFYGTFEKHPLAYIPILTRLCQLSVCLNTFRLSRVLTVKAPELSSELLTASETVTGSTRR